MNPSLQPVLLAPRLRKLSPYWGQVASHSFASPQFSAPNKQIMSRNRHVCLTAVTQLQMIYPCWQLSTEATVGANATITASIEYPAGTFTQVTFNGGSTSGAITDGSMLTSDVINVTIPSGAAFFSRTYQTSTAGIVYSGMASNSGLGETATFAASGVVDQTMGGTVTATSAGVGYGPIAILGNTTTPSFYFLGDSRCFGLNDSISGSYSAVGEIARSFNDSWAYINAGVSSATAQNVASTGAFGNRARLLQYCSHVICQLGINDMQGGGRSANDLLADIYRIKTFAPGKRFYVCTVAPISTSTDSWATTGNQTPSAVSNTRRVSFNNMVRQGGLGFTGTLEIADAVESTRDSGIWKAPSYTGDGIHESATGYAAIASSGNIAPATLAAQ